MLRAALAAVFLAAPAGAQTAAVHSIWNGNGYQDNGTSWTIMVTFYSDGRADIAYTSLNCGGRLEFLGQDSATGAYSYREILTYGFGACIDKGKVVLVPAASGLDYLWYYPDRATVPGATGTLVQTH